MEWHRDKKNRRLSEDWEEDEDSNNEEEINEDEELTEEEAVAAAGLMFGG